MKPSKKSLFILTIAVLIIAVFLIFKKQPDLLYYEDLVVENIRLDGKDSDYSLKDGKILRGEEELSRTFDKDEYERVLKLALFYQSLKESPVLFDPNLEIEKFDGAVKRLREANEIFDSRTGWGFANPVSFLESFSIATRAWRSFAQDISEENAQKMLSAMRETQRQYSFSAERMEKIFREAIPEESKVVDFKFLGGETRTDFSILAGDFGKIVKNAEILSNEIGKRENCFERLSCERFPSEVNSPEFSEFSDENQDLPEILPLEEIGVWKEEIEGGPYQINSRCWKNRRKNLLFAAKKCVVREDHCLDWAFISDGDYFAIVGNSQIEKTLKEKNVEYVPQSATAPYGCPDSEYKTAVRTILSAFRNYQNARLFQTSVAVDQKVQEEAEALWEKGKKSEENFFDAKYPSDEGMEKLSESYARAYELLSKNNLANPSQRKKFLERAVFLKGKSSGLDLVLNRISLHFRNYAEKISQEDISKNKPEYSFAMRTDYAITFLDFSPFVWKNPEKPTYLVQGTAVQNENVPQLIGQEGKQEKLPPIISRQKALEVFGEQKIAEWIQAARLTRGDRE